MLLSLEAGQEGQASLLPKPRRMQDDLSGSHTSSRSREEDKGILPMPWLQRERKGRETGCGDAIYLWVIAAVVPSKRSVVRTRQLCR